MMEIELTKVFFSLLHCRLERVVHDQVRLVRLSHRGRRPVGRGPQQQLPQPVLQLHGESKKLPYFKSSQKLLVASIFFVAAVQKEPGGPEVLRQGGEAVLPQPRQRLKNRREKNFKVAVESHMLDLLNIPCAACTFSAAKTHCILPPLF